MHYWTQGLKCGFGKETRGSGWTFGFFVSIQQKVWLRFCFKHEIPMLVLLVFGYQNEIRWCMHA
jgi:hypothetical protein